MPMPSLSFEEDAYDTWINVVGKIVGATVRVTHTQGFGWDARIVEQRNDDVTGLPGVVLQHVDGEGEDVDGPLFWSVDEITDLRVY